MIPGILGCTILGFWECLMLALSAYLSAKPGT